MDYIRSLITSLPITIIKFHSSVSHDVINISMKTTGFSNFLRQLSPHYLQKCDRDFWQHCRVLRRYAGFSNCSLSNKNDYLSFYPHDVFVSAVLATATSLAGWLAGCLSVTRRYCIKTAKPILKLFRTSGSPIILVSSDPCADTQFQG